MVFYNRECEKRKNVSSSQQDWIVGDTRIVVTVRERQLLCLWWQLSCILSLQSVESLHQQDRIAWIFREERKRHGSF